MDITEKCKKNGTMLHCFEFDKATVKQFIKVIEKKKLCESGVVESLIRQWLKEEEA